MFIRRWAPNTCLNGAGFTDARLEPGDRLYIGPVELEVMKLSPAEKPRAGITPPADRSSVSSPPEPSPSPDDSTSASRHDDGANCNAEQHESCVQCRQEREEMESALALRVQQSDQEKGALTQRCIELIGDLRRTEASRQDLLENSQRQSEQVFESSSDCQRTVEELKHDFTLLKQRYDDQLIEQRSLVVQAADAEQHAEVLETQVTDLRRQIEDAHAETDRTARQCADLHTDYDQQLRQLRSQLDDASTQLETTRQRAADLELRLQELSQQAAERADHSQPSPADATAVARIEELAALQQQFDELQQSLQRERAAWELDEQRLREELEKTGQRLQDAIVEQTETAGQADQLHSQLDQVAEKLAATERTLEDALRQRDENAAEVTNWKEVVDKLRLELQQERDQHQCVRNEWHAERESLQHELSERSAALEKLQLKHNQEMQEAEFLIHSLQQEGKQLLAQLDEAKQVIRKDIEKRKRFETHGNAEPATPKELPSRCPTMPMTDGRVENARDSQGQGALQVRTENSDDAEEQTTAPPPGHSADPVANCTIMMSATELNDLGCGQQVQEATESCAGGRTRRNR